MRKLLNGIKNFGTLNYILIVVLIMAVLFNLEMVKMWYDTGSIPETYAVTVMAALLGECGFCGLIFRSKLKLKERELEYEFKKDHPDYNPSDEDNEDNNESEETEDDTE